jgi:hypothetical protein
MASAEPSDLAATVARCRLADENLGELGRWWIGPWDPPLRYIYRPLTESITWVEWRLWGDDWDRWSRVALALQVGISLTIFAFFGLLMRSRLTGFVAAMLFTIPTPFSIDKTVLPLCLSRVPVQSELWCAFFYLASLYYLARWLRTDRGRNLAWSLVFFVLAALSKEMAYTLPIVGLLTIGYEGHRRPGALFRKGWPLLAVGAALVIVHTLALHGPGGPMLFRMAGAFQRFGAFAAYPLLGPLGLQNYWPMLAGAALAILIVGVVECPVMRRPLVLIATTLGVWAALAAAARWLLGSWEVAVVPEMPGPTAAVRLAVMLVGGWLLLRERPGAMIYTWLFAVIIYLPTFPIIGFSYVFLPNVGWAALTALLAVSVYETYRRRWPRRSMLLGIAGLALLAANILATTRFQPMTGSVKAEAVVYWATLVLIAGALHLRQQMASAPQLREAT